MNRRPGRRAARGGRGAAFSDPLITLAFDRAWRADDAADNGALVTTVPAYIGTGALTPSGTSQAKKAASASLNGRQSIVFNGLALSGPLVSASIGAVPTNFTKVTVGRYGATNSGLAALISGVTPNTGTSQLHFGGNAVGRFANTTDATKAFAVPANIVQVNVVTPTLLTAYVNSLTPASVAGVSSMGDIVVVGALDQVGTFTLTGEWALTAFVRRALSLAEVTTLLSSLGARYGITITP